MTNFILWIKLKINMTKTFNPRNLVLNKEVKVSNGVYGKQTEKRDLPRIYFEVHNEEID